MMDDPRHTRIHGGWSARATPRMIRRVEDDLRRRARGLLDGVEPGAFFDFVVEIAAELPMQMICILLGVPKTDRHLVVRRRLRPGFDFCGSREVTIPRLNVEGCRIAVIHLRIGADRR